VGQRSALHPPRAMWHVEPQATSVRVTLRDAFGQEPVGYKNIQLDWLLSGVERPLGSVGLIAADEQHFGRLLREIGEHYHHYRESALLFSEAWRHEHDPARTAAHLTGMVKQASPLAYRAA